MGEYLKYKNEIVKIGTCESLYYTSYEKFLKAFNEGHLKAVESSAQPSLYIQPDAGFLFRFPFPDEDKFVLGDIGKNTFDRTLPITVNFNEIARLHNEEAIPEAESLRLGIAYQKLVHREEDGKLILALVVKAHLNGEYFRIENDKDVAILLKHIYRNHVMNESDPQKKNLYRMASLRILKGYRGVMPVINEAQHLAETNRKPIHKGRTIRR